MCIACMTDKYFLIGYHKVGVPFGYLMPRLVTSQFDAFRQKAVGSSIGNYCRGDAFNSKFLAYESIAILPKGISRERFDW